jgi:DNA polymerase-3 subunit beta
MQVKFIKSDIVRALNNASLFLKKSSQNFLQALWLKADAEKNDLILSVTDSQAEYTATIQATIIDSGLVGVNGKIFIDLVKRMEGGEVTIKANKNKLSVLQGKKRYSLLLMESSWYQENEQMPESTVYIASDLFKEAIEKVAFCIHSDPAQEGINCLFIGRREKEVKIVGMDGGMMAMQALSNDALYDILEDEVLINKKMVDELKKILPINGQIELAVSDKRLFVRIDEEEVVSFPKSNYNYPDFVRLLKTYPTPFFIVDFKKDDVLDALDRLSLFNTDLQSVQFDFKKGKVVLSNTDNMIGDAMEEIECNSRENFTIIFNLPDLQKILKCFVSENVKFCINGSTEPCFFKSDEDVGYLSVTMPIEIEKDSYEERNEAKE